MQTESLLLNDSNESQQTLSLMIEDEENEE